MPNTIGRPASRRPSLHQIVLHQFVDRVIALDAADLVDLLLRDRLLVGNDREGLHHDVGQNRLLRLHGDVDKIIIIFCFVHI